MPSPESLQEVPGLDLGLIFNGFWEGKWKQVGTQIGSKIVIFSKKEKKSIQNTMMKRTTNLSKSQKSSMKRKMNLRMNVIKMMLKTKTRMNLKLF